MQHFQQNMRVAVEKCKYNLRVKYYPGESDPVQVLIAENYIFNPEKAENPDWEPKIPDKVQKNVQQEDSEGDDPRGSRQSWLRAKRRAYDYIRSDRDLDCFLTLTLDGDQIARDDWQEVVSRMSVWLDNRVRRHGLKYILCPEYHADGKSIHFHGLCNFGALKTVAAVNPHTGKPLRRKGKQVYNVEDFPFGFSTAIRITGDEASKACAGYIFKYMSKQGNNRIGGRYYLSGGKLACPVYLYGRIDYDTIDAYEIPLQGAEGGLKIIVGDQIAAFMGDTPASAAEPRLELPF